MKDSGKVFIYEQHPFAEMLSSDSDTETDPLKIVEPYFKSEPYEENEGIDYVGKTVFECPPCYWFVWTLSDIIMATVESNLTIKYFNEYKDDISESHERNEKAGVGIPLSYILIAEKAHGIPIKTTHQIG